MINFRLPGDSTFRPDSPGASGSPFSSVLNRLFGRDTTQDVKEDFGNLRRRKGRGTILTDQDELGNPVLTRPRASRTSLGG